MNKLVIFILLLQTLLLSEIQAQREVIILPDSVGALNNAILGDTTANGERIDPNTVYILKRNGIYKTSGEIQNRGYKLTIKAEPGEGSMPFIQPTAPTGGESSRVFTAIDDLSLEGIYLTNVDDFGRYLERMIRINADSVTVSANNCWFDGAGQSLFRLDNTGIKVYLRNSIVSHIGRTFVPNNGRVIDIRENSDSVVVQNCTLYNITSRLLRMSEGRYLTYAEFDHNTIMNIAQRGISFDQSIVMKLTNNIFINPGFLGTARVSEIIELEDLPTQIADLIQQQGLTRQIDIGHNLFYTTELMQNYRDTLADQPFYAGDLFDLLREQPEGPDSTQLVTNLTFSQPIRFKNPPEVSRAVVEGMIFDEFFAENPDNGTAPNWDLFGSPFNLMVDQRLTIPWDIPYSFSYSPNSFAATAATDGGPLGDRNWALEALDIVLFNTNPEVENNFIIYPNPANDIIYLKLLPERVKNIRMFNISGQVVLSKKDYYKNAVNIGKIPSGLYLMEIMDTNNKKFRHKLIKK